MSPTAIFSQLDVLRGGVGGYGTDRRCGGGVPGVWHGGDWVGTWEGYTGTLQIPSQDPYLVIYWR